MWAQVHNYDCEVDTKEETITQDFCETTYDPRDYESGALSD